MPFKREDRNVNIAASNTTYTSGTVVLSGGGNVTVGTNAQTVTISAAGGGGGGVARISASDSTFSDTVRITGGPNITVGTDASGVSISGASQTVQTQNIRTVSASDMAFSSGQVVLTGAGALTVSANSAGGQTNRTVTLNAPAQTVQTQSTWPGGIRAVAGSDHTVSSGTAVLTGAGAVTVSGNTAGGGTNSTVTINAPVQSVQTQAIQTGISGLAASNTTYTSGTVSITGVGGGITVSSNTGQRVDLSVAAPVAQTVQTQNRFNATLSGNTAGVMAEISSGTMTLAGGPNVTVSQAGNAVSISAPPAQTVQTQNRFNLSLSGNTTGTMAEVSSGTLTLAGDVGIILSQSATNKISIMNSWSTATTVSSISNANAVGANAGRFALEGHQHYGVRNLGISTAGNTSGTTAFVPAGSYQFVGSNGITLSQSTDANSGGTLTVSGNQVSGLYFDNAVQAPGVSALTLTVADSQLHGGRLLLQPLTPANEAFPFDMTASTMLMDYSGSNTATSAASTAFSTSVLVGVYTRVNSTQLSLLNSASRAYTGAAATANTQLFHGPRWLSFHNTAFSSSPVFRDGSAYWLGVVHRTSSFTHASFSIAGMHLGSSVTRSGQLGTTGTSGTSLGAAYPFMGVHSLTTFTAMPASIANSDINKASTLANFVPHVILDAGLGSM